MSITATRIDCWECRLYDPGGEFVNEGYALTTGEGMALVWIHAHCPDALIDADVPAGEVPYQVPPAGALSSPRSEKAPSNRMGRGPSPIDNRAAASACLAILLGRIWKDKGHFDAACVTAAGLSEEEQDER